MIHRRHLTFWTVVLAVFVTLLWLLRDVLLPFVAGLALAYLQVPLADRLERLGLNRTVAALLIVGVVILLLILLALLLVPILAQQAAALITLIPTYLERAQTLLTDPGPSWLRTMLNGGDGKTMSEVLAQGAGYMAALMRSLWSGGRALASFISVLVVMPVVTFYLICDWHEMVATLDGWVPPIYRPTVRRLAGEIDTAISGFLRGQAAVCLTIGIYYAVGLSLIGLEFGLLIGLAAGVLTFMPYVGSIAGLLIGTSVAVGQFWPHWPQIAAVVGVFLVGEFAEANVLSPKLVGEHVGLHPVWLIFAMFAFGYLFGFVGLLVAVPLAAAIAVLFRFGLSRYFESPFYRGEDLV